MRVPRLLLVFLFLGVTVHAATFRIPSDRALVEASSAIVVVTVGESHGQYAPGGWIETVTAMRVDEAIKGPMHAGDAIDVTELGGIVADRGYAVAGSPAYTRGERLLLFLETNSRGEWTAKNMVVGKFAMKEDVRGRRLLLRDAEELTGWDMDGSAHHEPVRLESSFLRFVRDAANGRAADAGYLVSDPQPLARLKPAAEAIEFIPAANTYLTQVNGSYGTLGARWANFPEPVVFYSHGIQPAATNGGITALQRGLNAWTLDTGSNIVMQYGGTTTIATGFAQGNDGVNTIQFDDPSDEIPGAYKPSSRSGDTMAVAGVWYSASGPNNTHIAGGTRFYTITGGDVVVQNGIFSPGLTGNGFDSLMAHALGHVLGFRHSNDVTPVGGKGTNSAVMNSFLSFDSDPYGAFLQPWDTEAAKAVYGAAMTLCNPPVITAQPHDVNLVAAKTTLFVSATGDDLHFQWYFGRRGNTAMPVAGATTSTITVQPLVTTAYWVRVTNACTLDPNAASAHVAPADSDTAYVIVNECPQVTLLSESSDTFSIAGNPVTLSLEAFGGTVSYQWYIGASGVTSSPIPLATGRTVTVTPLVTTSYWARATNSCGSSIDTTTMVVTAQACRAPQIVVNPAGGDFLKSHSAVLYAGVTGAQPLIYQWYEGAASDTSRPVANGTDPTLITAPVLASTTYWLRVTNACGSTDSAVVPVTAVDGCSGLQGGFPPHDQSVPDGSSAILSVGIKATSLLYHWYQGQKYDFSKPVGGSAPSLLTGPIHAPTQFWIYIDSPCTNYYSEAVTVTPLPRRRPSK